jgi:hypothetical protein
MQLDVTVVVLAYISVCLERRTPKSLVHLRVRVTAKLKFPWMRTSSSASFLSSFICVVCSITLYNFNCCNRSAKAADGLLPVSVLLVLMRMPKSRFPMDDRRRTIVELADHNFIHIEIEYFALLRTATTKRRLQNIDSIYNSTCIRCMDINSFDLDDTNS